MKVSYDKPRKQQLVITYKLTKDAPDEEAFPSEGALIVRTGANRAAGIEWPAFAEALISILPDNPQIAADLKAALLPNRAVLAREAVVLDGTCRAAILECFIGDKTASRAEIIVHCESAGYSANTASGQLYKLKLSGLIKRTRQGKYVLA